MSATALQGIIMMEGTEYANPQDYLLKLENIIPHTAIPACSAEG
jgi:hypothetical protein